MSRYLIQFAKTGDPNAPGLPQWPRYARASDRIMDFATDGKAVARPDPWGRGIEAAQGAAMGAP